jgi:uncharacterized membrane protein YphA (DoxX/SURF4 family)
MTVSESWSLNPGESTDLFMLQISNLRRFEGQQDSDDTTTTAKIGVMAYRVTTSITVLELLAGGVADLANLPPVNKVMTHLGYPAYFTRILGGWKVLGAMALLLPEFPRLREWAYAGTFFEMTGAAASHVVRRDKPTKLIAPLTFSALAVASWALQDFRNLTRKA